MIQEKILVLDTGKEWGGGTNSLLELLKRIDKKDTVSQRCFTITIKRETSQILRQK